MRTIYLDYNATTPLDRSVREAMLPFLGEHFGDPSSDHRLGRACCEALSDARTRVATLLGAERDEIVFTSGGTEGNNLALQGCLGRYRPEESHLIISALEHPSVSAPAAWLARRGYALTIVPCDHRGLVAPEAIAAALRPETRLVSVMLANHEIGAKQPLAAIAALVHAHGATVHADAAQAVGKMPVHVGELDVDLLTIAGHKFYGPKGAGALYVRRGVALEPQMHGAGQEASLRAGTENVAAIIGLGHAAALVARELEDRLPRLEALRDRLQSQLVAALGEHVLIHAADALRLPNTLSLSFPGIAGRDLLRRAPELCASTGAACHAGGASLSPTLAAMGLSADEARGAVRLSLGWQTTESEIDRAAELLLAGWDALHQPRESARHG